MHFCPYLQKKDAGAWRSRWQVTLKLGWQHWNAKQYRQVKYKSGGGVRSLEVTGDESVEDIKSLAHAVFFKNGESTYGKIDEMESFIGDYEGKKIITFKDRNSAPSTFAEYLKSFGLFASRFQLYLFTKTNTVATNSSGTSSESLPGRQNLAISTSLESFDPGNGKENKEMSEISSTDKALNTKKEVDKQENVVQKEAGFEKTFNAVNVEQIDINRHDVI